MALLLCPARAQADEGGTQLTTAAVTASAGAVAPGDYWVQSSLSGGYMLDVSGASRANGANVQIYAANKTGAQRWRIAAAAGGTYTIQCVGTGKYLDARAGRAYNGNNVWQYAGNGTAAQRWYIEANGSGWVIRSAVNRNFVVDAAGARAASGTNVWLYRANGTAAQRWWLLPASPRVASQRTVADGYYELRMSSSTGYALDVSGASSANGANVQVYRANGTAAQRWYVKWESDGYYSLRCASSGKVLDVSGANPAVRTNVWQYASNGTAAQRWAISEAAGGTYTLTCKADGLALDVSGGSAANGTNVQMYLPNGTAAQRFVLRAASPASAGVYTVGSLLGSGQVVDIPAASRSAGAQAQTYSSNGTLAQRLVFERVAEGTFAIRPACSGLYLADSSGRVVQQRGAGAAAQWRASFDGAGVALTNVATGRRLAVSGGKAANGSKLVTAAAASTNAQRFSLTAVNLLPNGYFELRSAASTGRTLDVSGGSSANGANVQVYAVNSTAAQAWYVQYVSGGYYKLLNDGSGKALEASGSNVRQNAYGGAAAQLWRPELQADGTFAFSNKATGGLLTAAGSSNGSNVGQAAANGSAHQRWQLVSTTSRALSGNAELDSYLTSIAKQNGYNLRKCFNWVTSNIKWQNSVSGEVLSNGIVGKQKTIDLALYAFRHHRGDCYYYAAAFMWLARACGYSAEVRAGHVPSASSGLAAHGWVEVYSGGTTYICDPNLAVDIGGGYNWYMTTYASAPVEYYL